MFCTSCGHRIEASYSYCPNCGTRINVRPEVNTIKESSKSAIDWDDFDYLKAAVETVLETEVASVSILQRKLRIGYARAARLIDEMEEMGIVGPFAESNPREILITHHEWEAYLSRPQASNHAYDSIEETANQTIVPGSDEELQAFCKDHPLLSEFYTKVVGVTYDNDDGSCRQRILRKCKAGDPVLLHPFTYRGDPAFAVYTEQGQIGNLSADLAYNLENEYECDVILAGVISEMTGGSKGTYWGCNLLIKVYKA